MLTHPVVGKSTYGATVAKDDKTLDTVEEKRYKEKLEAVGLLINDDHYSPNFTLTCPSRVLTNFCLLYDSPD